MDPKWIHGIGAHHPQTPGRISKGPKGYRDTSSDHGLKIIHLQDQPLLRREPLLTWAHP